MNKKLFGVCLWFSKDTGIKAARVRVSFLVTVILGAGMPILIYMGVFLALRLGIIE